MRLFVGLDVSLAKTAICVISEHGQIVKEAQVASEPEPRKGQKGPDPDKSILRASVLMLCATWELYCESLLMESVEKVLEHFSNPSSLPGDMQAQLKAAVHNENVVRSTPLRLAGTGWRKVYSDSVASACDRFNTPKAENLNDLYKKWIGLKLISDCWTCGKSEVDDFVSLRGEIAHRGSDAQAVTKAECIHYRTVIEKCIRECDDAMFGYLRDPKLLSGVPWQRTNK